MYKCIHFGIKELVSPIVYNKFGEQAWQFFGRDELEDLDTIRETWGSSITINDWANGGQYQESGLRSNMDSLVKGKNTLYCGAHCYAKGFDLKDKMGRNAKLHAHVCNLISKGKLKSFRRVENLKSAPTWVHADSFQTQNNKLVIF